MIKKMFEYFALDLRLDIFRFWLQLAGGLLVVSEESSSSSSPSSQWRTTVTTTSPPAVLQHRQSGQHQPPANILHHLQLQPCETLRPELVVCCLPDYPGSEERHQLVCEVEPARGSIVKEIFRAQCGHCGHCGHWDN